MKLMYVVDMKIPTPNAHGIHVVMMCEAFANLGIDTTLVAPYSFSKIKDNPYDYYGVERNFKIKRVHSINLNRYLKISGYWLRFFSYSMMLVLTFAFKKKHDVHIHTREFNIAYLFKKMGYSVSYEAHRIPSKKDSFFRYLKGINQIVTNSQGVADEFYERGFTNVLSCRHGIDPDRFKGLEVSNEVREKLGLPVGKRIVMYTGALYGWKGIDTVLDAAKNLSERSDIKFILLGGNIPDVKALKKSLFSEGVQNVLVFGHVDYKKIPRFLVNADALLLPNNLDTEESVKYTSPIKLPQYMASRVPIIASDLPSIGEVLNKNNAILIEPENEKILSKEILNVVDNPGNYSNKIQKAYTDSMSYTWLDRARDISNFLDINPKESDVNV